VIARDNAGRGVVVLGPRQRYDGIVSESNGLVDSLPQNKGEAP
jgi:hypothetical protein